MKTEAWPKRRWGTVLAALLMVAAVPLTFNGPKVTAAALIEETPAVYPTVSTVVSSPFGTRKDPFTRKSTHHNGIDISGRLNDPVFSTGEGNVVRTGYERTMGNFIVIEHGNELETVYMHLNKALVKNGQRVQKGEQIGLLGTTGRSTGPHLHYEVRVKGQPVNPNSFLKL